MILFDFSDLLTCSRPVNQKLVGLHYSQATIIVCQNSLAFGHNEKIRLSLLKVCAPLDTYTLYVTKVSLFWYSDRVHLLNFLSNLKNNTSITENEYWHLKIKEKHITNFQYLANDVYVRAGIAKVQQSFWRHKEPMRNNLPLNTKKRLLQMKVWSILRYATEMFFLTMPLKKGYKFSTVVLQEDLENKLDRHGHE